MRSNRDRANDYYGRGLLAQEENPEMTRVIRKMSVAGIRAREANILLRATRDAKRCG